MDDSEAMANVKEEIEGVKPCHDNVEFEFIKVEPCSEHESEEENESGPLDPFIKKECHQNDLEKQDSVDVTPTHFVKCEGDESFDSNEPEPDEEDHLMIPCETELNTSFESTNDVNTGDSIIDEESSLNISQINSKEFENIGQQFKTDKILFSGSHSDNSLPQDYHVNVQSGESLFKCSKSDSPSNVYKCLKCGYSTTSRSNFNGHSKIHLIEKPYKCGQCDYSTVRRSTLREHLKIHTGERPFKCTTSGCDYSTAHKSMLRRHLRTHTGEKPFKCAYCSYASTQTSNLKLHLTIHSSEKPFKCLQCEFAASRKQQLDSHLKVHSGERPFKCSECNYSAAQKASLRRHIRTHTGEKPFKCPLCDYIAAQKSSVNLHLKNWHHRKS